MKYNDKPPKPLFENITPSKEIPEPANMVTEGMVNVGQLPREQFAAVDFR